MQTIPFLITKATPSVGRQGREAMEEEEEEGREDLKSILPFLPLISRSNLTLFWPPQAVEALKTLSQGPLISNVNSGDSLFVAISDIRNSLTFSISERPPLSLRSARLGYALFFDDLMSRADCTKWFEEVVPALANLLLRFPSLLESHYQNSDSPLTSGRKTGLRLLGPQQEGIVFLSQELIGAILACAFFCLFPVTVRYAKHLPIINFNYLFESLYDSYSAYQENKIKCIIHYFGRICSCMPRGFVSFERKVLPLEQRPLHVSYPKADFWSESEIILCPLKVSWNKLVGGLLKFLLMKMLGLLLVCG
uniref:PARG helical domain-containing protein n=1 Tax=Rhizophora mucronata TaxID=61149 RepID=A0A2P2KS12_RHIMU